MNQKNLLRPITDSELRQVEGGAIPLVAGFFLGKAIGAGVGGALYAIFG